MAWIFAGLFFVISLISSTALILIWQKKEEEKSKIQAALDKSESSLNTIRKRMQGILNADAEKERVIRETNEILQNNLLKIESQNQHFEKVKAELIEDKSKIQATLDKSESSLNTIRKRMQGILNADAEKERVIRETNEILQNNLLKIESQNQHFEKVKAELIAETKAIEEILLKLRSEHALLTENIALSEVGFYKPYYGFATSLKYKQQIEENKLKQKEMLTNKLAATCSLEWAIDGSIEKGRKHTEKYISLLIRAFNGECDAAIAKIGFNNYQSMENRIQKAFDTLNKLGELQHCSINKTYFQLRLDELRLEYEHELKIKAEREEQRAIKEEMRQQAIAQKEIEKAQQKAELEERQFEAALAKAREEFAKANAAKQAEMQAKLSELEALVAQAQANKERAISLAQQTRAGHVYVISNIGSFGSNIYKIGMTRRLDPMDRIWELSDASVPFDFDVHAIIYTDDAPTLETELHQRFADKRVNVINTKKEFFNVTIEEIASVVREKFGDIELTLLAEASEYLQSEAFYKEKGFSICHNRQFSPEINNLVRSN